MDQHVLLDAAIDGQVIRGGIKELVLMNGVPVVGMITNVDSMQPVCDNNE